MTPATKWLAPFAVSVLLAGCAGNSEDRGATEAAATQTPGTSAVIEETATASDETVPADTSGVEVDTARHITVGGSGADYGPPDRSVVDIGVSARRPSVAEATQQASAAGASMIDALEAAGVAADDIQTSQFGVNPYNDEFDYTRVVGYESQIGYRVTISDPGDLGSVLARAIEAGGDSVRAWSVSFEGDPAGHMEIARTEAWDDVRARAAATAAQLGEPLGEVIDVHEKVLVTSPRGMMEGGEGDTASFQIPIAPGVVGVIVLLTVTYGIGT